MNRIIKFRAFAPSTNEMIPLEDCMFPEWLEDDEISIMQFTGHQIGGKDVYESDIIRLEEDAEGVDPEDKITFYVVTWIKEWCMFCLLRVQDEYTDYRQDGISGLDTSMFWTFPLELQNTANSKHYLCGNIFENANLLSHEQHP